MSYRFEYALSGRSKCTSCGDKIDKETLRVGTSGAWQHWTCTKEEVIVNIIECYFGQVKLTGESDFNCLGGFSELEEEHQVKIRKEFLRIDGIHRERGTKGIQGVKNMQKTSNNKGRKQRRKTPTGAATKPLYDERQASILAWIEKGKQLEVLASGFENPNILFALAIASNLD